MSRETHLNHKKGTTMIKHRIRRIEALLNRCDLQGRLQPPSRALQTVQDVIDLLQEQVEAVRAERWAGTIEKARALAYLAGVARRALEDGTVAARIDVLEQVLNQRKAGGQR